MSIIITDDLDRTLMKINDRGEYLVGRHPDMSDECKEYVLKVYTEVTDGDVDEMRRFMNFEGEEDFCS